jgi:hypothetical protein
LVSRIGLVATVPRPRTIYNQSTYIPEVSSALQHIIILLEIFSEMTKYGKSDSPEEEKCRGRITRLAGTCEYNKARSVIAIKIVTNEK